MDLKTLLFALALAFALGVISGLLAKSEQRETTPIIYQPAYEGSHQVFKLFILLVLVGIALYLLYDILSYNSSTK